MEEVKGTKLVIQLLKNRGYQDNPQSKTYKLQICKIHGKVPDAQGKEVLFVELADTTNIVFALIPTSPTNDDDFDCEVTPGTVIKMWAKANYHVMSHGSKLGVYLFAQEYQVLSDGTALNERLPNVNDHDEIRKSLIEVERMLSADSDDKFAKLINIDELKDRAIKTEKVENDDTDVEMKLDSDYDSESDAGILLAIGGENESDPHLHNEKSYSSPDPKRAKLLPVKDSAQPITDPSNVVEDFGWKQSKWVQDYECIIPEDQQRILSMLDGWSLTESKPQATPRVNNSSNLIEVPCEVDCQPIPMSHNDVNRNTIQEQSIESLVSQFICQRHALQVGYTPQISFNTI